MYVPEFLNDYNVCIFQNVASFLTKDLKLDWRLGAEWFESMLVGCKFYSFLWISVK